MHTNDITYTQQANNNANTNVNIGTNNNINNNNQLLRTYVSPSVAIPSSLA